MLKKKRNRQKKIQKKQSRKKNAALAEFNAVDKQINDTELEIASLETQMNQTEKDIDLKTAELAQAEADYIDYENLFLRRARVMYESSEIKYLEILFGARDFSDFLTKIELISQLMKYDKGVLVQLDNSKKKIQVAKTELEDILARQKENAKNLSDRKAALSNVLAAKKNLLEEAEKDSDKYKAIYEAAEAEEKALIKNNSEALSYGANPVKYNGGNFLWPVPGVGRITSNYGYRIHPVYKTNKFHSGIDIGAGYGINIVASASGVVTLSTTNGGYGKCIIINHGSGITTLYAHCSSLLVSKGDKVEKGQVIAKIGSTGVSTGPHLHYEVRVNGATRDPLGYVRP